MDPLAVTSKPGTPPAAAPERCRYCGAPLVAGYYFCLNCATPYQDVDVVLPRVRPERPSDGMLVQLKAPHVQTVFWSYFSVVLSSSLVMYLAFGRRHPGTQMLFGTAALFVTTCIFAGVHWPALAVQLRRVGLNHWATFAGLGMLAPLLVVNWAWHGWLIRQLGAEHRLPLTELRESGFGEAGIVLFFCVLPAVVEEISFRGLVQHWLHAAIKPWHAIGFAAFLFTVLHFSILSFPYLFAVGVLLGWARWKTGSLYPSMLLHFAHNFVAVEMFSW